MFKEVHSKQEEGWRSKGAMIVVQINPFLEQREHNGMTSPSDRMTATTRVRRSVEDRDVLTRGIMSYLA